MGDWFAELTSRSECGRLAAAVDWSRTPIGAPSTWEPALRTAVEICLTSEFPMLVTWGPELVKIYNDGYRQLLGDKHPAAMGSTIPEVWPEILDVIAPLFEQVMTTGEPTWHVDQQLFLERRGFSEECYFTYGYSPLLRDDGSVGGVLDVVWETTDQVIGTRWLACLGLLAARLGGATDVADVCEGAIDVIGGFDGDVLAAEVHLVDEAGAKLLASAGPGIELAEPGAMAEVTAGRTPVEVPLAGGGLAVVTPFQAGGSSGAIALVPSDRLPFDQTYRSFLDLVAGYVVTGLVSAARRAAELTELRRVSDALQRAMLTIQVHDDVAVRYVPAADGLAVGGDWYDVLDLPGGRLAVLVGDCVGHGLEAATRMGQLRSASRALLLEGHGPATMLTSLDRFAASVDGATCTTVLCGIIDPAAATLTYASAGHPAPVLVGDAGAVLLDGGRGIPLSTGATIDRHDAVAPLHAGDALVLYTDGLVERRGEDLDVGFERLRAAVAAVADRPVEAIADALLDELLPDGGSDDVAVLVHRSR